MTSSSFVSGAEVSRGWSQCNSMCCGGCGSCCGVSSSCSASSRVVLSGKRSKAAVSAAGSAFCLVLVAVLLLRRVRFSMRRLWRGGTKHSLVRSDEEHRAQGTPVVSASHFTLRSRHGQHASERIVKKFTLQLCLCQKTTGAMERLISILGSGAPHGVGSRTLFQELTDCLQP